MKKFQLFHGNKYLGDLCFHRGKYTFKLSPNITLDDWNNKYGIIPLNDVLELEQSTLFEQFNIRLPLQLRKANDQEKLDYIKDNSLRVISDSYELRP